MVGKRKRQSTLSKSIGKKWKRQIDPISSVSTTTASIPEAGPISNLPSEILTQVLSYILAANPEEPIMLHSTTGRRWRNELHALTTVNWSDWRHSTSQNFSYAQEHFPLFRKSARSNLIDILLVSRPFYFAGIDAFFGGNVFAFEDPQHLDQLTSKLDLDRRRKIHRVVFPIPLYDRSWLISYSPSAVGAQLSTSFARLLALQAATFAIDVTFRQCSSVLSTEDLVIAAYRRRLTEIERVRQQCLVKAGVLDVEVEGGEGTAPKGHYYTEYESRYYQLLRNVVDRGEMRPRRTS